MTAKHNLNREEALKFLDSYPSNNEELAKKYLALCIYEGKINIKHYDQAHLIKNYSLNLVDLYNKNKGNLEDLEISGLLPKSKGTLEFILDGYNNLDDLQSREEWVSDLKKQVNLVYDFYPKLRGD